MSRCLDDHALVRLAYDEGAPRWRRHLDACPRCRERVAAIVRGREVAATVLRRATVSPVERTLLDGLAVPRVFDGRATRAMAPLAAAALLAVTLVFFHHAPAAPRAGSAGFDRQYSLDEVAASAFALDDADEWLEADADDVRWEAALRGEGFCETADGFSDPQCD